MVRRAYSVEVRVIKPEPPAVRVEHVELQAVHSGRVQLLHWCDLTNGQVWRQG